MLLQLFLVHQKYAFVKYFYFKNCLWPCYFCCCSMFFRWVSIGLLVLGEYNDIFPFMISERNISNVLCIRHNIFFFRMILWCSQTEALGPLVLKAGNQIYHWVKFWNTEHVLCWLKREQWRTSIFHGFRLLRTACRQVVSIVSIIDCPNGIIIDHLATWLHNR